MAYMRSCSHWPTSVFELFFVVDNGDATVEEVLQSLSVIEERMIRYNCLDVYDSMFNGLGGSRYFKLLFICSAWELPISVHEVSGFQRN